MNIKEKLLVSRIILIGMACAFYGYHVAVLCVLRKMASPWNINQDKYNQDNTKVRIKTLFIGLF